MNDDDTRSELYRRSQRRIRYKVGGTAAVLTIIFLSGIIVSTKVHEPGGGRILTIVLALFAALLAALLDSLILRPESARAVNDAVKAIEDAVGTDRSVKDAGLVEVITDQHRGSQSIDRILESTGEVNVLLNHGAAWVTEHRSALNRRFKNKDAVTYFLIAKPESLAVQVLAHREVKGDDLVKSKIAETIEGISNIALEHGNRNTWIKGYESPPSAAVIQGAKEVAVSPYFTAPRQNGQRPPKFIFRRNEESSEDGIFAGLAADIEALKNAPSTIDLWTYPQADDS